GRYQRHAGRGTDPGLRRRAADRRIHDAARLRRVLVHPGPRPEHHHRPARERHQRALPEPSELLEGVALGTGAQLQAALYGGILRALLAGVRGYESERSGTCAVRVTAMKIVQDI